MDQFNTFTDNVEYWCSRAAQHSQGVPCPAVCIYQPNISVSILMLVQVICVFKKLLCGTDITIVDHGSNNCDAAAPAKQWPCLAGSMFFIDLKDHNSA